MNFEFPLPNRERLLGSRWIRPFAHRLRDTRLWHLNRESTARGLALGFFIGLLVPIGQTPLAAFLAISLRAHVIVAAAATLVTNPLTFPLIYFAALRWGETVLATINITVPATESLLGRGLSVAAPIAVGLSFFAIVCGASAYIGVKLFWRIRTMLRWRKRASPHIRAELVAVQTLFEPGPSAPTEALPNAMVERHG
jgi:uncharacterized protein (DUF2062 family)